jgi:hypothetical protein
MAAFSGFKVGDRLRLTRDALNFAKVGDEVEIVAMLGLETPGVGRQDDGIRVKRADGGEVQFVWECGASYFK